MTMRINIPVARLDTLQARYEEIEEQMALPDVATNPDEIQRLAKERSSLEVAVSLYREYTAALRSLEDAKEMLRDPEMEDMARAEIDGIEQHRADIESQLQLALVSKDPNDEKNVIVEIRSGTGGDEAALFAADLFRIYGRYAEGRKWQVDVVDTSATAGGGFKEIVFEIRGQGAYSRLKHESGVHRVQRVPTTEANGRIHTSTATVAVLPEAEEVEVGISPEDVRIDIFHAGGAGGQNVNKVATAVRITHLPTGLVVVCQDERSQHRNRSKAMGVLRARLLDIETRRQHEETAADRRSQVGSGERAEKVRTYNFPQNRVTDHRINLTTYNLDRVLEGDLGEFVDALSANEHARKLEEAAV
jgi:peptide chain release factor 1